MPSDFSKYFTDLGLSSTETSTYLASLQLGPTSVQEIAKKARLSRTTAYEAIATLQERGLISTYQHGKKKFFTAEDPERAMAHFRSKVADFQSQVEAFGRLLPELKMMTGGERPAVRFLEGREALFSLFNDMAQVQPKTFDEVSNLDDLFEHLDMEYVKEVRKVVDPTKIRTRILHRGQYRRPPREYVESCELLPELGNFHGDLWIYGDRVAFVAFVGKVMAVIIESEVFADTARVLFEAAWQVCRQRSGQK